VARSSSTETHCWLITIASFNPYKHTTIRLGTMETKRTNTNKKTYPHQRVDQQIMDIFSVSSGIVFHILGGNGTPSPGHHDVRTLVNCSVSHVGKDGRKGGIHVHHDHMRNGLHKRNSITDRWTRRQLF
jgi:hypothetical protein